MVTRTSENYWLRRLASAIESAAAAPSERSRAAYLTLANHYRSMHELVGGMPITPGAFDLQATGRAGFCDMAKAA